MNNSRSQFFVFRFLSIVFCTLFLSACGAAAIADPHVITITCHTAYRSSTGVPIEKEESFTFDDRDETLSMNYSELAFNAQYSSGKMNNERALRLWVAETGKDVELLSQLYQLHQESGPNNQFVGGHGFTGLNYAYHPTSRAELQFWCTAD